MRYTVALTGGIGSGKSTVADAFSRLGINVIDADIIARQVVEPEPPRFRPSPLTLVHRCSMMTAR
ncbi:dephospho-CoA kinase [Raoultella ornithinolytica]|nr:dephospho-CoA kinase [Raoultella ornithinolytica]